MTEVRCPKHGWQEEWCECSECAKAADAVYDAAMAVTNNRSLDFAIRVIREEHGLVTLAALLDEMVDACRRAKEGK